MSILIKGLKMPKMSTCIDIVILADGTVVCYDDDDKKIGEAVELPDHGDLIDRDALKEPVESYTPIKWSYEYGASIRLEDIDHAPVVISAERSEASPCENCDKRSDVGCSWCEMMEIS